jgi:hypothetical protein
MNSTKTFIVPFSFLSYGEKKDIVLALDLIAYKNIFF